MNHLSTLIISLYRRKSDVLVFLFCFILLRARLPLCMFGIKIQKKKTKKNIKNTKRALLTRFRGPIRKEFSGVATFPTIRSFTCWEHLPVERVKWPTREAERDKETRSCLSSEKVCATLAVHSECYCSKKKIEEKNPN